MVTLTAILRAKIGVIPSSDMIRSRKNRPYSCATLENRGHNGAKLIFFFENTKCEMKNVPGFFATGLVSSEFCSALSPTTLTSPHQSHTNRHPHTESQSCSLRHTITPLDHTATHCRRCNCPCCYHTAPTTIPAPRSQAHPDKRLSSPQWY